MSDVSKLNIEYKILKRNIKKTKRNLLEESLKRNYDANVAKTFDILDCSIKQTNALFKLARYDGEVQIMKNIIKDNFKHERLMIQNLAIKIYRVTRSQALEIIYDMSRNSIDEELKNLHYDFEDIVKSCSVEETLSDPDFRRVYELFAEHQSVQRSHDLLFNEAIIFNNIDDMYSTIAYDIPNELKIVHKIRETVSRLQSK